MPPQTTAKESNKNSMAAMRRLGAAARTRLTKLSTKHAARKQERDEIKELVRGMEEEQKTKLDQGRTTLIENALANLKAVEEKIQNINTFTLNAMAIGGYR